MKIIKLGTTHIQKQIPRYMDTLKFIDYIKIK